MRLTQAEIEARQRRYIIYRAHHFAKQRVLETIKAQGLKVARYSAKEIASWADLYFDDHREALLAQARAKLSSYAQQQNPHNSTTSTVRMSGAK